MMPRVVICDPELTVGMPPFITAGTGMDALAHCLEAYCASSYHPMAEGIAVEGMRLVFTNLPKAVANGNDLEARAHMMSAAAMGAAAFQKGLGAIHALSHPVGALYHTHHGMTNGVFMPYVLVFNRSAIEAKIERLAGFLGIAGGFDDFLDVVLDLRKRTGVPHDLGGLGVDGGKMRPSSKCLSSIRRPAATPFRWPRRGAGKFSRQRLKVRSHRLVLDVASGWRRLDPPGDVKHRRHLRSLSTRGSSVARARKHGRGGQTDRRIL